MVRAHYGRNDEDPNMSRLILPPSVSGGESLSLDRAQLALLAAVGQRLLTKKQECRLTEICKNHVYWKKFERESVGAYSATRVFTDVIKDLTRLSNTLANMIGMQTPQHHHVHILVNSHLERIFSEQTDPAHTAWEQIRAFQYATDRAFAEHRKLFAGPGRSQTTEGLRMFIWDLADLFERTGGKASANFKGFKDRPDSPFLRWVIEINSFLPIEARARPTALPYLVRNVCRSRVRRRAKNV